MTDLRLVPPLPPEAPGQGWLRAAAVVEVLIAALWILGLVRGIDRGLEEDSARVMAAIAAWGVSALAFLVDAVFLWRARRWAWRLGLGLGGGSVLLGLSVRTPAAILVGAILLVLLYAGSDGIKKSQRAR